MASQVPPITKLISGSDDFDINKPTFTVTVVMVQMWVIGSFRTNKE